MRLDIVTLGEALVELASEPGDPSRFRLGAGGDTSNLVVAASRLGAACGYVTRVGGDRFGRFLLDLWAREGVDTGGVRVDPEGFTGLYLVVRGPRGRREFVYYRAGSAASRLGPGDVDRSYLATARAFHTSGITQAISPTAEAAALAAMDAAREAGLTVSYDANARPRLRPGPALRESFERAAPRADLVFLSEEDCRVLFPEEDPGGVARRLLASGPRLVVLKRGPRGCEVFTSARTCRVPGWRVREVDPTGAGDAFAAGFLVQLLQGASPAEAARFAAAVGALAVTGVGAVAPLPRRRDVERLLRSDLTERGVPARRASRSRPHGAGPAPTRG